MLVVTVEVACVDFGGDVVEVGGVAVGDDEVGLLFELVEVVDDGGVVELVGVEGGFVDDDLDAFGFDAFHDALDG